MKIFILLFIFLASLWSLELDNFASSVNYKRDYNTAIKTAKQEHKMLMLVVVADYCPWSKKFERKTLKDDSVSALVNENFVPVIIDKHRDEGSYPKKFKSQIIPAIFFIDPISEDIIYKSLSYIKQRDFIYHIDEAIKLFKEKKMIKKLFLLLLLPASLFCASVFTLDNVKNLKFHFTNNTYFLEKSEEKSIKDLIKNKLQKAGFTFGEADPINFIVKVKSVEIDDIHVISVFLGLAEDVTTKRIDNIQTQAFTFMTDTLIESEDPYEDTLEAIDFLTCRFLTAYKDDNEQNLNK